MTIQFENTRFTSASGSCLRGYIKTTYDELVSVFGEPTKLKGDKVNVEWTIKFSDGTVATIYDWKLSTVPMGVYNWHIGGFNQLAVDYVNDCVPQLNKTL
jgi:hypothetical protein